MNLIQYNLKNTLNKLTILNQFYNQRQKWLDYKVPTVTLSDYFLHHYREKEDNRSTYCFTPTQNNVKIVHQLEEQNSAVLCENKNVLTALSDRNADYNNILQDGEVKEEDITNHGQLLKDFIVRMRLEHNKKYSDYTTDTLDNYFSPNNLRNFLIYRKQNGGEFVCADMDGQYLFTITKNNATCPNPFYNENEKPYLFEGQKTMANPFLYKFTFYKFSEKNINALILQDLFTLLPKTISPNQLLDSILNMWKFQLLQHKTEIKGQTQLLKDITNNSKKQNNFINFLKHLFRIILLQTHYQQATVTLTYQNICDFYNEVQKGILTNNSRNIISYFNKLILPVDEDDELKDNKDKKLIIAINKAVKMLSYHPKFIEMGKEFQIVNNYTQDKRLLNIINQMKTDNSFTDTYQINTIFKINHATDNRDKKKYPDIFWGIHGTQNFSLPSILLNGLKNSEELAKIMNKENQLHKNDKNYIKYELSGQSLGQGVYFAQPNQPTKSIFFMTNDQTNTGYLVVASIRYNKNAVYTASNFGDTTNNSEITLIQSKHIGVRSLNEYVAPISKNIQIEYLIEVTNK